MSTRKITRSFDPQSIEHRVGITFCPCCQKDYDEWEKTAVVLALNPIHGKHGSAVVVSECPHCFEKSWVHESFDMFNDYHEWYPEEWKLAARKERDRRHLAAAHIFADSLCAKCIYLRTIELDTLPIVSCTLGEDDTKKLPKGRKFYYSSCFTETKCNKFKLREK